MELDLVLGLEPLQRAVYKYRKHQQRNQSYRGEGKRDHIIIMMIYRECL